MNKLNLGKLERIHARDVFDRESTDFTPWLAQSDNLSLLGETIGMTLCLESREQRVGLFRADILCRDEITSQWVLIENQLDRTDHTHLGQILTYVSGLKASTIVWIAGRFTEEHRAVLDWLNEITLQTIRFIGVQIEFWRIGQSDIAPRFHLVSMPNTWTREVSREVSGEVRSSTHVYDFE